MRGVGGRVDGEGKVEGPDTRRTFDEVRAFYDQWCRTRDVTGGGEGILEDPCEAVLDHVMGCSLVVLATFECVVAVSIVGRAARAGGARVGTVYRETQFPE